MLQTFTAWLKNSNPFNNLHLSRNIIIFLNLLLLGLWFVIFSFFSFLVWEDPGFRLRYPLKWILWQSVAVYPLFIILGMIFAFAGKFRKQFRLLRYGIVIPLTIGMLILIFAIAISIVN